MKKILVIEDDQIFANVYRNKLVLDGFTVEIAGDGEAGLELLRTFRPDAVLLDLILPKLSGVEVIRHIRRQPDFEKLPLIVFSNTYLTSTVQEAWKAGATKCLAKSNCTPNQVISTLISVLGGNGANKPAMPPPPAPSRSLPLKAPVVEKVDARFQAEMDKSFADAFPATLSNIRASLQNMIKADNEASRLMHIQDLQRRVHLLTGSAGVVGLSDLAVVTDGLEALLQELHKNPRSINASSLRTVASAVDFLKVLFDQGAGPAIDLQAARALVVDDEAISRRAIVSALERAKLKSVAVAYPREALKRVSEDQFDLIFLDVDMPDMNGFELCTKLRALPNYAKTPVIFVTGLNDFESRANSTVSGGNDFIAKPFVFVELAVKAVIFLFRSQLQMRK